MDARLVGVVIVPVIIPIDVVIADCTLAQEPT